MFIDDEKFVVGVDGKAHKRVRRKRAQTMFRVESDRETRVGSAQEIGLDEDKFPRQRHTLPEA